MLNWILNIIGIVAYFIGRFAKRKSKTIQPTFKFWFKDNWAELTVTFLINLAIMLIVSMKQLSVNMDVWLQEKLPFNISIDPVVAKAILSLGVGLIITHFVYESYLAKIKGKK